MNKLRNTLITLGILGMVYGIGNSINRIRERSRISSNTPYKKVVEIDSKISSIKYKRVEELLEDPNQLETLSQLTKTYDILLKEREQLLQDPNIVNLEKKLDSLKGDAPITNVMAFGGMLVFGMGFCYMKKKK